MKDLMKQICNDQAKKDKRHIEENLAPKLYKRSINQTQMTGKINQGINANNKIQRLPSS